MRILITVITINLLMLFAAHQAQAEVNYNFKNADHVADKECIALMSIMRDSIIEMGGAEDHPLYLQMTDYQNQLILKYAYSKQLNTHVDVWKTLLQQRFNEGKWMPTETELITCINRI